MATLATKPMGSADVTSAVGEEGSDVSTTATAWSDEPRTTRPAPPMSARLTSPLLRLANGMIERAVHDGIPGEILLADSAYGESHAFREAVRLLGFD